MGFIDGEIIKDERTSRVVIVEMTPLRVKRHQAAQPVADGWHLTRSAAQDCVGHFVTFGKLYLR